MTNTDQATKPQTLAQQFAAEYAKGVVPAMLKAIKAAKRDTRVIVAGVLAITYPHQALWLTTIPGIGPLGWAIPAVVDLAMLRMLGIVQTTGMRRAAKTAALVMTGLLALMSGAVNVAAPGAVAARAIFGALVLMAAGVKIVTSLVGPDFAAIEASEAKATEAVKPVSPEVDPVRSEAARKAAATRAANAEAKLTPQQKAARTRAANKLAKELEQMADGYVPADAPVSPAPAR